MSIKTFILGAATLASLALPGAVSAQRYDGRYGADVRYEQRGEYRDDRRDYRDGRRDRWQERRHWREQQRRRAWERRHYSRRHHHDRYYRY